MSHAHYPTTKELINMAYRRFKLSVNEEMEIFIDREEKNHIFKLIIKIVAPTIYILAVANGLDKWRTAILVLLAFLYGVFKVGMLSLKFFKELLVVLIEWKQKKIQIEGRHYVYIILILCFLVMALLLLLIFMLYSQNK